MTDISEQIKGLWAQSLGAKNPSPDDNFFAAGGHSLLGVKLVAAVQEKLGLDTELSLSDLLENPTLAEFCDHVEKLANTGEESGAI